MLRTPEQYLESLRDNRCVYYRGERVADVTTHPELSIGAHHCAIDYRLALDPSHQELATYTENRELLNRYFKSPTSAEDLLRRRELIELGTRAGRGVVQLIKEIGTDFLFAHSIVARQMEEQLKTPYLEHLQVYHRLVAKADLALAVAQTDVKGDRSLGPSEQEHPDYYVRVVDRQTNGIVVRGAKAHTTNAVFANELIVLPTRNLSEADRDYALAFAVPANAKGVKLIVSPFSGEGHKVYREPVFR